MSDFSSYQSPFSWRYGSELMRVIWSEYNKRLLWRRLWVELADAECDLRLVSKDQVEDLRHAVPGRLLHEEIPALKALDAALQGSQRAAARR